MDTTRGFIAYSDDKTVSKSVVYLPHERSTGLKNTLRWVGKLFALLTLISGVLVTARVVEKLITVPLGTDSSLDWSIANPAALDALVEDSATPGISIAAATDQNGSRQLYDLDSEGRIHVRLAPYGYSFGTKQRVSINPPPKANSPLTAVAWAAGVDRTVRFLLIFILKAEVASCSSVWSHELIHMHYNNRTSEFTTSNQIIESSKQQRTAGPNLVVLGCRGIILVKRLPVVLLLLLLRLKQGSNCGFIILLMTRR
jgi:hypothetical protein